MIHKTPVGKLYALWLSSQTDLANVVRWKAYVEKNSKLRPQTTDKHTLSFSLVGTIALMLLRKHAPYDEVLLQTAIKFHDLPEGFLQRDILASNKQDENDRDEYVEFIKKINHFDPEVFKELERAFLLQFALRCPDCFPEKAKEVMRELRISNYLDVRLFPALESWEYVFYAYESYLEHGDETVLTHFLRNQVPRLRKYAEELPGFRAEIFTIGYEFWADLFLKNHEHVPTQEEYFSLAVE